MKGRLLVAEYTGVFSELLAAVEDATDITLACDGWSSAQLLSLYLFTAIFPDRRLFVADAMDLTSAYHSAARRAGAQHQLGSHVVWSRG